MHYNRQNKYSFAQIFSYIMNLHFQESPSVIHVEIDRRLEEDGLNTDCSTEEKLLYIWRLYQNAEVRIGRMVDFLTGTQNFR